MTVQTMYDHIADAIAAMNPEKVLELHAPQAATDRLYALIHKEKTTSLTPSEKDELDHYLVLERLIRLAKTHARLRLAS
jgi:phosphate uptake regulator